MPILNYDPNETHVIFLNGNGRLLATSASSSLWHGKTVVKRVKDCDAAQTYINRQKALYASAENSLIKSNS
jgi:hypothetical protein